MFKNLEVVFKNIDFVNTIGNTKILRQTLCSHAVVLTCTVIRVVI